MLIAIVPRPTRSPCTANSQGSHLSPLLRTLHSSHPLRRPVAHLSPFLTPCLASPTLSYHLQHYRVCIPTCISLDIISVRKEFFELKDANMFLIDLFVSIIIYLKAYINYIGFSYVIRYIRIISSLREKFFLL